LEDAPPVYDGKWKETERSCRFFADLIVPRQTGREVAEREHLPAAGGALRFSLEDSMWFFPVEKWIGGA
jgi:hypothetical protein